MVEVLEPKDDKVMQLVFGAIPNAGAKKKVLQHRARRESPITSTFYGALEGRNEREKQTLALRPKVNLMIEDMHSE